MTGLLAAQGASIRPFFEHVIAQLRTRPASGRAIEQTAEPQNEKLARPSLNSLLRLRFTANFASQKFFFANSAGHK